MSTYKVNQVTQYDEIELEIVVGMFEVSEEEIEEVATRSLSTLLRNDGLHVVYGEDYLILKDWNRDKYQFRICTKQLPPPIDPRTLSKEEVEELFFDERYMTTPDDYKDVDWSFSQVYKKLKEDNPDEDVFSFSSMAYGYEKSTNE